MLVPSTLGVKRTTSPQLSPGATDSPAPFTDAAVTSLSLAATWGQAKKVLESWWIWILVDLISVPLFVYRGLYPTAALYAVFLVLCVFGLRAWSREVVTL